MNPTERDRRRYEGLVREHAHSLYRYSFRLTTDPDVAEDLVQETFEQAWRGVARLLRAKSQRAWLFRILKRRYGRWVKRQVNQRRLMGDNSGHGYSAEVALSTVADRQRTVEQELEDQDVIQIALSRLDDRYKQPLLLVVMEGLTVAEAARALGVRKGTVMSRLYRGRQQLKQSMTIDTRPAVGAKRQFVKSATAPRIRKPEFIRA